MSNVIQWNDAMDQCGNDEEFLKELLVDLRTEAGAQLEAIGNVIQVRLCLLQIMSKKIH